ncbi:MAG: glycoside hydrolase family 57 protein [Candidatus Bathyarchaeota archaeon]|nr:glycoside hydrolase family 57 protein [Candidatus Bathyarchaeota archaeon]
MTDVVFVFEVHQPHRLRKNLFWENKLFKRAKKEDLFNYYFDNELDREIFERAAKKCYFPSNQILLDVIDEHKKERCRPKFAFSLSGVFLEQCESFSPDLLETFRQLAKTGCVEFLNQTYYHSVASLYADKDEFVEQVTMHRETIKTMMSYTPQVFENTELLYNNAIAKIIENLGYKGIYTEGVEKILGGNSPNYLYTPKGSRQIRLLLRNYKLTDDVGFRFSARWWSEWPLTAEKYAHWLADTQGDLINIFPDYETFGEHHWPETGIHKFLKRLPEEILKWPHLHMATPSEAIEKYSPRGEVDVSETKGTVSWADVDRDSSGWLGNAMQWAYYTNLKQLEPIIHEADDAEWLRLWRNFQTSDHLYYMFAQGGAPGEVHSYFSPYESPLNAFVAAEAALLDFGNRVRLQTYTANEPFLFSTAANEESFTGTMTWTLKGFLKALRTVDGKALEFHNRRGDFTSWAEYSLQDWELQEEFNAIKASKAKGEALREKLVAAAQNRYRKVTAQTQEVTRQF